MDNLIQQLKDNEKPFGLLSEEMQAKLKTIDSKDIECLQAAEQADWHSCFNYSLTNIINHPTNTYRLRADYEEEPEIVECELYTAPSMHKGFVLDVYDFGIDRDLSIALVPNGYKRVGFKFEDGTVFGSPVKYSLPGMTSKGYYASYEDLKTSQALEHHAVAVLFRRSK